MPLTFQDGPSDAGEILAEELRDTLSLLGYTDRELRLSRGFPVHTAHLLEPLAAVYWWRRAPQTGWRYWVLEPATIADPIISADLHIVGNRTEFGCSSAGSEVSAGLDALSRVEAAAEDGGNYEVRYLEIPGIGFATVWLAAVSQDDGSRDRFLPLFPWPPWLPDTTDVDAARFENFTWQAVAGALR